MKQFMLILLAGLLTASVSADPVAEVQVLNLEGARSVMTAAVDFARKNNAPGGAIAIVDTGGHVILLERLDNTFAAAPDISVGKARTAMLFRRPTRGIEEAIVKGRTSMVTLPDVTHFTPLQGGVPLEHKGQIVGAIGVSGAASAQQDDDIATAAAEAFKAGIKTAAVMHIEEQQVKKAFAVGGPLVEDTNFKVHASRRDGPGEAEIHLGDTDIFYVLEGSASFVTGGELVDAKTIGPDELRGSAIVGGQAQNLAMGDVITVPSGVPHWFESVHAPFVYYVVKSSRHAGG